MPDSVGSISEFFRMDPSCRGAGGQKNFDPPHDNLSIISMAADGAAETLPDKLKPYLETGLNLKPFQLCSLLQSIAMRLSSPPPALPQRPRPVVAILFRLVRTRGSMFVHRVSGPFRG